MKIHLPLLLLLATSLSAVPSDINYQGRLTDANGDAVTGDVSMSVKMYDAQSGGNEIYSEDIGTVTLDENGVYRFQFGASGNSTVTKTETIVTSDGTSTEYTGTFTSTPIDGTISVTDETYSWNDIDGNPGEQATAYIIIINGFVIYADIENGGSGYDDDNPPLVTITGDGTGASATATVENGEVVGIVIDDTGNNYTEGDIAIAPPPAPFTVDKVDGNLEVGYTVAPVVRTGVVATYKTLEPSIIGALSEASSHWLELTVDGIAQNPRERILSVPFAQLAGKLTSNSEENERLNYQFGSEENPVTISEGEVMEIEQLFAEGINQSNTRISVDGRGSTTISHNNLKLPFFIPGPATVRSDGYGSDRSYFVYRIHSNDRLNYQFGSEENPITISEGEVMEIEQLFAEGIYQSNTKISIDGRGSTTVSHNNLKLPFFIPGPATVRSDGYGSGRSYFVYRVFNSDGSVKKTSNNIGSGNTDDPYENGTFSIVEGSFSWDQALADAESRGGRLAVLNTFQKSEEVRQLLESQGSWPNLWIGAGDVEQEGDWKWINGDSMDDGFTNWHPGEPSNTQEEDYLVLYSSLDHGLWNDEGTAGRYGYILESIAPLENSIFEIIERNLTWHEAKSDAESRGGRLAVLNTQGKINSVYSLIADHFNPSLYSLWIGCSDHINEGDWVWVDGTSVVSNEWGIGEPNNGEAIYNTYGSQHYGAIKNNSMTEYLNYWDDVLETNQFWYILEKPTE